MWRKKNMKAQNDKRRLGYTQFSVLRWSESKKSKRRVKVFQRTHTPCWHFITSKGDSCIFCPCSSQRKSLSKELWVNFCFLFVPWFGTCVDFSHLSLPRDGNRSQKSRQNVNLIYWWILSKWKRRLKFRSCK